MLNMKANRIFKLKDNNSAYARMVGGLVALLITIIIGVLVYWSISPAITLTNDEANDSRNVTDTTASTVFGLLPIIGIVAVGGIMIGVVMRFGGGG